MGIPFCRLTGKWMKHVSRKRAEILMLRIQLAIVCVWTLFGGCRHLFIKNPRTDRVHAIKDLCDFRKEMRSAYIDQCKWDIQMETRGQKGGYYSWTYQGEYKVVYSDANYVSFYTEAFVDSDFYVHGGTLITVGTIDRKTCKVLKATDLIPEWRRAEVLSALIDGVAKKLGGRGNLLNDPKIIDNCYLDKDGIHFVYNEYVVASFKDGPVEVVVQVPTDATRPVTVTKVTTRPLY